MRVSHAATALALDELPPTGTGSWTPLQGRVFSPSHCPRDLLISAPALFRQTRPVCSRTEEEEGPEGGVHTTLHSGLSPWSVPAGGSFTGAEAGLQRLCLPLPSWFLCPIRCIKRVHWEWWVHCGGAAQQARGGRGRAALPPGCRQCCVSLWTPEGRVGPGLGRGWGCVGTRPPSVVLREYCLLESSPCPTLHSQMETA